MADTVADVLVRLGVDTEGLRSGFRDARTQTTRFADDFAQIFSGRGGRLGAIGGATRAAGDLLPGIAGEITRAAGGILSTIGRLFSGLFTKAAREIASRIRTSVSETLNAFRSGSAALGATIQQLEQQRAEAIRKLSGKKGGRKELDRLLPQIDQALAGLREQQQAIFAQFESRLDLLRTGSAFREVAAGVRDAVAQYREYVAAGGDLARANEFLSRTLEELRGNAAVELEAGERQAIEDALELNRLLHERQAFLDDIAAQEQRIRGRGVLERQRTVAQDKSIELEALRKKKEERLAEFDFDIRLLEHKLAGESQIFDLARERTALETRLLELKAREFDRELAQLAALRDVVAGIAPNAAGIFSIAPQLRQELNLGGVTIYVGENVTPAQAREAGTEVIESMLRGLARERARFGSAL